MQEHFESTVLFNYSIVDDTTCVPSLGSLISACVDGKLATCGVVIRALEYIRCKILSKFMSGICIKNRKEGIIAILSIRN